MNFSRDIPEVTHYIKSYHPGELHTTTAVYTQSIIIYQDTVTPNWEPVRISHLTVEHIQALKAFEPELILLGTGSEQHFPDAALLDPVYRAGIGIEVMSSDAACRTFNLLVGEGRNVLLAVMV